MSALQDLLDLPKILLPYIFHPLTAAEVFLPHFRPVSWLTKPDVFSPEQDIPSLQEKVIIVTGGNAGLGEETIFQLLQHEPAKVYLAARSQEKARTAINRIQQRLVEQKAASPATLQWLQLDLSNLKSVQAAAEEVLRNEQRLDIIILNAGIMASPPSKTPSGHDLQLGTNHIGHFLLVKLLVPLLEHTASSVIDSDVRVITVSSEAHHLAPTNMLDLIVNHERLCSSSNYTRYGVTHFLFDDVRHGSLNALWCASARRDSLSNGKYHTPVGRARPSYWAEDRELARKLWSWTEEQVKAYS
ncbi:hypothetical protein LTR51_002317 [Lithohypha guttulata]|nr:hypothetical protein LTR51_002317 [Lithohypha guttulata]